MIILYNRYVNPVSSNRKFFAIDNISPFLLPFNLLGVPKAFCMISTYPAHSIGLENSTQGTRVRVMKPHDPRYSVKNKILRSNKS